MSVRRSIVSLVLVAIAAGSAAAQNNALGRALDLENAGKFREAATAYREAYQAPGLDDEMRTSAILGLERSLSGIGQTDSLFAILDPALRAKPRDPTLRTIQLRSLQSLGRVDDMRAAFDQWRAAAPTDPAPYREYARLLLQSNRPQAADTVLQIARRQLRGTNELALETAQMQAALGLWTQSAASWRDAMAVLDYAENAAVFSLQPAPPAARDTIRVALLAPPVTLPARRALAELLVAWRRPADAWSALAALPPNDSSVAAWRAFAERTESQEQWGAARDAWTRVAEVRGEPRVLLRAASAALSANDPTATLALLDRARDSAATRTGLMLRIGALARLGRAADAQKVVDQAKSALDAGDRARASSLVADAWVRAGDVTQARASLAAAGDAADESAGGWLALYGGDLKAARALLKRPNDAPGADPAMAITALALLSRTRVDSSAAVGDAFLSLARRDSARAAERFESAATSVADASSLLLATAARLRVVRRDTTGAVALWQRVVTQYAESPEAPEAELAWARTLLARGEKAAAGERLEHLIVTYPRSALVPIARRELERAK